MRNEFTQLFVSADGCPALDELRRLLDTVVSDEEESKLSRHLDGCNRCRERLASLVEDTPFAIESAPTGEALRKAMDSLTAQPRRAIRHDAADEMLVRLLSAPREEGHLGTLGPYSITEVIGRGGMGIVFKAFDPSLHRFVAIKVLAPQLALSVAARLRFAREARAAAAVSHEHVVAIHGVDEANGLAYLVMEYVPGISLQERLDRDGALDVEEILRIGVQTATGLAAAHGQGLVHRDVKPANILLEHGMERVKITDFGLARAADDASLTQSGSVAGTPPYMAPEQARGEALDHRADLFSLGSVLFAMCTGEAPFQGGTLAVLRQVSEEPPPPVRLLNPAVPEWLAAVVGRLHSHDPEERFASATEVAELLQRCLAHLQQPSHTPAPRMRAARSARGRFPWRWALPPLATAAVLIGVAMLPRGLPPKVSDAAKSAGAASSYWQRATLSLPSTPIYSAAFSPGSELLAFSSDEGMMWLMNLDPERLGDRRSLLGHDKRVWSVAFSPDGRTVASGGGTWGRPAERGELILWDARNGEKTKTLAGHAGPVFHVAFSPTVPGLLASCGWDGTVRLWDTAFGRVMLRLEGHVGPVRRVEFFPDGKTLATAGFDGTVRLWDSLNGRELWQHRHEGAEVFGLAISPDGRSLAAAVNPKRPADLPPSLDPASGRPTGWVVIHDAADGQEKARLTGARGQVLTVAFSPDGATLATGGGRWRDFGEVTLWDVQSSRVRTDLHGPREWVEYVGFSPDGRTLITAGGTQESRGEMYLWGLGGTPTPTTVLMAGPPPGLLGPLPTPPPGR